MISHSENISKQNDLLHSESYLNLIKDLRLCIVYAECNSVYFKGFVTHTFHGMIFEEENFRISDTGFAARECENTECPYFKKIITEVTGVIIVSKYSDDEKYSFKISANFPYANFNWKCDDKNCLGIIFSIDEVKNHQARNRS